MSDIFAIAAGMHRTAPLFYASRTDGHGERLRAILNARVLAEHFGGRFGFLWGEMSEGSALNYHSVASVSETFSSDFIAAYHLDEGQVAGARSMQLDQAMQAHAESGAFPPEAEAIEVRQVSLFNQGVVSLTRVDRLALLRKAWDDLQLAPALEAARHLAGTVPLPARVAAVHLRAGDIVYGDFRMSDRFHQKVCSYPIVEEIIRIQKQAGITPILFGQDLALCRYLRDRHGALLASDLSVGQDFDESQQAIFDIALMSRCERILAGQSGFAVLASWIAGVERSEPLSVVRPKQTVALIETAIFKEKACEDVSPLQRAFACRNAFVVSGIPFPTEPRFQRLLDHAREMDPQNDFYHFVQAVASYASGDAKTGEAMIGTLLLGKRPLFWNALLNKEKGKAGYQVNPYLPVLTKQAELGFANAAMVVSRAYEFRGDKVKAAQFADLFHTLASADLRAAGRSDGTRSTSPGSPPAKSVAGRTLGAVLGRHLKQIAARFRSK